MYMLRLLPKYKSSPLVRTRDPAELARCHTVVDVGGEYDPSRNLFDHHQRTFQETFPQRSTRLSSAGLVYLHFGKAIIAQHVSLSVDHEDVNTLYEKLYSDFIEALDAHDNGISVYDPKEIDKSGIQKKFRDTGVNLGALVGDINQPGLDDIQDEDGLFAKASTFIGEVFLRKLRIACNSWLPARTTVNEAYDSRQDNHPSGRIMLLPKAGIPWKEHLFTTEKQAGSGPTSQAYYVLYPESAAADSRWRIQCVPVSESSFESRKPLPEPWRGVRDEELDKILADEAESQGKDKVPEGVTFVHASGFIGGHKTREGVMSMAVKSMER